MLNTNRAQKEKIIASLLPELDALAARLLPDIHDPDAVDAVLRDGLDKLPDCQLAYVINEKAIQVSSNISPDEVHPEFRGQDLSLRPYVLECIHLNASLLSSAYIDKSNRLPCVSLIHPIGKRSEDCKAYLILDFRIAQLPLSLDLPGPVSDWQQIKGDPSIRSTLFLQQRSISMMDEHIDDVLDILASLFEDHGVFHCVLHFSSSRVLLWHFDDPYVYKVHVLEEIISPELCMLYPGRHYPRRAKMPKDLVRPIFAKFRELRSLDETIYLRSATMNIINGMVSLTFSCDGTHYMKGEVFLEKADTLF